MEINGYLFDSDILIDYLRGNENANNFLLESRKTSNLYISLISIAEIYSGKDILDFKKRENINEFLNNFYKITINEEISKQAGLIRLKYKIFMADALIAASAFNFGLILITKNIKHFKNIKNLKILSPY